jgi:hypothetical protein
MQHWHVKTVTERCYINHVVNNVKKSNMQHYHVKTEQCNGNYIGMTSLSIPIPFQVTICFRPRLLHIFIFEVAI